MTRGTAFNVRFHVSEAAEACLFILSVLLQGSSRPLKDSRVIRFDFNCRPWSLEWLSDYSKDYVFSISVLTRSGRAAEVIVSILHQALINKRYLFDSSASRRDVDRSGFDGYRNRAKDFLVSIERNRHRL